MGSDSDLPVMKDAAKILKEFDVPTEVIPVSHYIAFLKFHFKDLPFFHGFHESIIGLN